MSIADNWARRVIVVALLVFSCAVFFAGAAAAGETGDGKHNPLLGDPAAIDAGRQLYAQHCMSCHGTHGGRGPNLFETKLSSEAFLRIVMNGKSGTRGQMPPWEGFLTVRQVRQIEAFVKSRPHF